MPPETGSANLQTHWVLVVAALLKGQVVPLLGAGVNVCDHACGAVWKATEGKYLPRGWQPAEYLAQHFHYPYNVAGCPDPSSDLDLSHMSQHGATLLDEVPQFTLRE
jgi:hypothetical protein